MYKVIHTPLQSANGMCPKYIYAANRLSGTRCIVLLQEVLSADLQAMSMRSVGQHTWRMPLAQIIGMHWLASHLYTL